MITENYQKSSYRVYWKLEEVVIRSADKGARMPPEAESNPVDRSEKAIRAFPWLVAALPIVLIGFQLIEEHWGDTKFVTYLKTGRMDGAANVNPSNSELGGERGGVETALAEIDVPDGAWLDNGAMTGTDPLVCMKLNNSDYPVTHNPDLPEIDYPWQAYQLLLDEKVIQPQDYFVRFWGDHLEEGVVSLTGDDRAREMANGWSVCFVLADGSLVESTILEE